ncbi:MAG: DUF2339 domain-containing protein [Patescibacteria group bacterium]
MEFLIVISVVASIGLVIFALNLSARVQKLEEYTKNGITQHASQPMHHQQSQETSQPHQHQHPVKPISAGPTSSDKFIAWMKEDWLMKLGACLLLIGFGWLTTYAFLNNWIGPMGRITLGIIAGALFVALGWWRINKYLHQGGIFLVLGSTTILLTIFAAREIYGFFTPLSALAVMFLSTAFVALASVKYKSQSLALSSLILAGIAPLLTNTPSPNYTGLFTYLFVVILGAIWIVVLTGRRELTMAALLLVTFYSVPHLVFHASADRGVLLLFAYAFAAVFFITNTAGILKLKGKEIIPDLIAAGANGLFLLAWIMTAAQDEWKSLIISAWMIVFAVGAFLIFKITQRREPLYVYAGVGIAMLAAATSAELKGATLTIAYTIESGMVALVAYAILRDIKIAERMCLLLAGPMLLSIESITSRAWRTDVIHKDFFVLLVIGLVLLGLGLFFLRYVRESKDNDPRQLNAILLIAGSLYMYTLVWLSLHAALINNDTAVMIALLIYTIIGLITYVYGLRNGKNSLRLYGGILLGFVVGRLLFVDVWKMALAGRIVTFFLVGALLMSTAFLGKKKKTSSFIS